MYFKPFVDKYSGEKFHKKESVTNFAKSIRNLPKNQTEF